MSVKISGWETQLVKEVQKKLDHFDDSSKNYQQKLKELNELSAKKIELADMPAHEDRYQIVLQEYKKAAEALKDDAEKIRKATDEGNIHKY
ncbi:MAG TPA: hypothetical protein VFU89_00255, partial [Rhabdochlamydiaceae bacterium]|nr:hypothetical protein [Rhabdochlamydiaceae bacterium]